MAMPAMLAYTVRAALASNDSWWVSIGQGSSVTHIRPTIPDDSYWFYFLDRKDPRNKVFELSVPGKNNTTIPAGLDQYMANPDLIFGLLTRSLLIIHVPQGAFYDYLAQYGAGRQLTAMEQLNAQGSCGTYGWVSYILTGQGGPRNGPFPPPTYEVGSLYRAALLEMSLMPMANGQPPYSICDSHTFR
jgi:hypothetical protein